MIEPCKREQFANPAPSASRGFDGDLVDTWKRDLISWTVSPTVLLLGILIIFSPMIEGGTTHLPVMIMRLIIFGAVTVWAFFQVKAGEIGIARNSVLPVAGLFLGWAGLSLWWAPYKHPGVQWFISLTMYALLFAVIIEGVRASRQVRQVSMVIVVMGLGEGILGIIQYIWLGEFRAKGTFFNPNFFATYEVVALSIVFGLLSGTQKIKLKMREHLFLWGTAGILFGAFLAAQSRGALLAFVTAMTFIGFVRYGKKALIVIIVILIAGAGIPNPLKQRMIDVSVYDPYAYSRIDIWKSSLERVIDHPFGIGLGLYKYTSFQYRFPIESNVVRYGKRAESAHNEYLQMAIELGVAGLAIFLVAIWKWGREARSVLHSELKPWERGLVVGLIGAVLGILAHGAVDSVFHEPALVILLVLCGGLVLAVQSSKNPDVLWRSVPISPHPVLRTLVVVCGVVLAIFSIQPAAGWYAHARGQVEVQAGQQDLALNWFRLASLIDSGTTGYHDDVARTSIQLFHQSDDPKWLLRAAEEEALATELNPMDGRFPYRLGTIYGALAEQNVAKPQRNLLLNQAAQAYLQASQADPFSSLNYLELAKIRLTEGKVEEARALLKGAVDTEPNFLPARALLAKLSLKAEKPHAAQLEIDAIDGIKKKYEGRVLSEIEHQFLDVDPDPLKRALALESK